MILASVYANWQRDLSQKQVVGGSTPLTDTIPRW